MEQHFNFNNELSGKVALVTGGTKGAGSAIAERLLKAGATVVITARNKPEEEKRNLTGTEYVIDGGTIPTI